jgi:hypothetical protein
MTRLASKQKRHSSLSMSTILVVNLTKGDTKNYIGANTFLELGFAHYLGKRIYLLNPIPDQPYILDEVLTIDPIVLDGDIQDL